MLLNETDKMRNTKTASEKSVLNKKGVNTSSIACVKYRIRNLFWCQLKRVKYILNDTISRNTLKTLPQTKLLPRNTAVSHVTSAVPCRERAVWTGGLCGISPWGIGSTPHTDTRELISSSRSLETDYRNDMNALLSMVLYALREIHEDFLDPGVQNEAKPRQ